MYVVLVGSGQICERNACLCAESCLAHAHDCVHALRKSVFIRSTCTCTSGTTNSNSNSNSFKQIVKFIPLDAQNRSLESLQEHKQTVEHIVHSVLGQPLQDPLHSRLHDIYRYIGCDLELLDCATCSCDQHISVFQDFFRNPQL